MCRLHTVPVPLYEMNDRLISGGSRIHRGAATAKRGGAPPYNLTIFSQKLHENEEMLAQRGRASFGPPGSTTVNRSFCLMMTCCLFQRNSQLLHGSTQNFSKNEIRKKSCRYHLCSPIWIVFLAYLRLLKPQTDCSLSLADIGGRGTPGRAHPSSPKHLRFHVVFGEIGQIIGWRPFGVAPTAFEIMGSATTCDPLRHDGNGQICCAPEDSFPTFFFEQSRSLESELIESQGLKVRIFAFSINMLILSGRVPVVSPCSCSKFCGSSYSLWKSSLLSQTKRPKCN